jgi:hypothetical protein
MGAVCQVINQRTSDSNSFFISLGFKGGSYSGCGTVAGIADGKCQYQARRTYEVRIPEMIFGEKFMR